MSRACIPAITALVVLLVGATSAGAAVQRSGEVLPFSYPATNPCNGATGMLTGTETVSTLVDETANHFLYESTAWTTETFTPDDPTEPTASGHAVGHVSFVDNHARPSPFATDLYTDVSTSIFHAPGETLVIRNTVHVTVAGGALIVSLDRPVLLCTGL